MNSPGDEDCNQFYHFHIEFYPPLRSEQPSSTTPSSEMGAWRHATSVSKILPSTCGGMQAIRNDGGGIMTALASLSRSLYASTVQVTTRFGPSSLQAG